MAGSEIEGEVIWKGSTVGRCGELDLGKTTPSRRCNMESKEIININDTPLSIL
jgi:hypothetical protein